MECGMGRNCLLCTCITRKGFYRSRQETPVALSKWLDWTIIYKHTCHLASSRHNGPIIFFRRSNLLLSFSLQLSLWQTFCSGACVKTSPIYKNGEFRDHSPAAQTQSRLCSLRSSAHHHLSPGSRLQKLPCCRWQASFRHITFASPPAGFPSHPDTPHPDSLKDSPRK